MTSDNDSLRSDHVHGGKSLNDHQSSVVELSRDDIQELIGLCNSGQISGAENRARELLEKHRDSAVLYNILGIALKFQGKFDEARSNFEQALRIEPNHSQVHSNLGITLMCLGKQDKAMASLRQAVKIDPLSAFGHGNLGKALLRLGKLDEAMASLRQAVTINPHNAQAYGDLGRALVKQGKVEEGVLSYRQALKISSDDAQVHNNLANALKQLGRLDEALASYHQALKLKPDAIPYYNMHSLLLDPDDMSPAIECLEAAVKIQPSDISYKFFLGMLLEYAGRVKNADSYFKEIQQGSNLDKARLDAWNYIKSTGNKMPIMTGSSFETFRLGIGAAPRSGIVLEFGVRFGVTIRQIAKLAAQKVHGFDSFEGLPEAWHHEAKGSYTTKGVIPDVPDNIRLYKGWFENTLPEFLKSNKEPVRFVNIDCDLYSSTKTILDCLASQIVPGTVIVFDEYLGTENWREDEFKAFQEAIATYGWRYEYLAFSMSTNQTVVRIL